jgi:hypothetical protein
VELTAVTELLLQFQELLQLTQAAQAAVLILVVQRDQVELAAVAQEEHQEQTALMEQLILAQAVAVAETKLQARAVTAEQVSLFLVSQQQQAQLQSVQA